MRSLRWYPRPWRARYGPELMALMEQLEPSERSSWPTRFDLARAGLRERLRILAPGPLAPDEKAREGALLVLYAWMLFVVGGFSLAKLSENWRAVTPLSSQSLPSHAFSVLYWAAGIGSVLVLAGVAVSLPACLDLLRRGRWIEIRRAVIRAVILTTVAVGLTIGLSRWAHSLTPGKRNGGDSFYSAAFVAWFAFAVACLFAWATAAAAVTRRLELSRSALRVESLLAVMVGASMLVMTAAAIVWWASLANVAPWFFSGRPIGSTGSVIQPNIVVASVLILSATLLGLVGATRSARGALE